jgi:hypothetical protein
MKDFGVQILVLHSVHSKSLYFPSFPETKKGNLQSNHFLVPDLFPSLGGVREGPLYSQFSANGNLHQLFDFDSRQLLA